MVRRLCLLLAAVLVTVSTAGAAEWKIDKAHSSVGFEVKHLVISKVRGDFQEFDAQLQFDDSALQNGEIHFTVQTASIDTDNEDRDKHLRTGDFLDAENFPTIDFKSSKVLVGKNGEFKLVGNLTLRGVTKEVTFDCHFNGVITDPWGNTKSGFSAETRINRQDFKVAWSKTLDSGGLVVSDEVKIMIEAEFSKAG